MRPGLMILLIVTAPVGSAMGQQENPGTDAVAEIFQADWVTGTLVVASADGEIHYVHNDERARLRYSPASTFKILNTLIALEAGAVTSKDARFTWDGTDRGVSAWNQDQTLESAFRVSCVWCYQEIAREVGLSRYASELASVDYGNKQVGDQVDRFWLNGDLQISALEQVAFLEKLLDGSIPYEPEQLDVLKAIMLDEESSDYAVYAKTGWTGAGLHVGWYVGYVETGDETWLFAMNMRMDHAEQAALRKALTLRSLRALGVL